MKHNHNALYLLTKRISYAEINFIKFSCASYKIGWYSQLAGIHNPPEIFDHPIAKEYREKWQAGFRERGNYLRTHGDNTDCYRSELIPHYFFVLYSICPHCGRELRNDKTNSCLISCAHCGFSFSLLEGMPHAMTKLFKSYYPNCAKRGISLRDSINSLNNFVKRDYVIASLILLLMVMMVVISNLYYDG